MTPYLLRIDRVARHEINEFGIYAGAYGDAWAKIQFTRLRNALLHDLAQNPHRYPIFRLTGPPFRARLFSVGRRTSYWIVFTVDESSRAVDVLRFWNSSRDPTSLKLGI